MMPIWGDTEYLEWSTGTDYTPGDIIIPGNGYSYKVIVGGESGTEPAWPTSFEGTVTDDNGVVYECWAYYPQGTPKEDSQVFNIPVPYGLPEDYYGYFEIQGPLTGARRHHMTPNKLSIGGTRERLLADELWEGSGGRYPDDIGVSGKVWRSEVYGFYVLWGLRWIDLAIPYIPFGHAKVFPIQPVVELKQVAPGIEIEVMSPDQHIDIIENPGG